MTVALAFDYFAEAGVDIAVIEVGLGGRLDSTNIINPVLSVITNIGHDHFDLLGDTFEKVAGEKAGIIKPGVPLVISEMQEETKNVFIKKAAETGSEIFFADQNYSCFLDDINFFKGERTYRVKESSSNKIFSGEAGLTGDYQAKNIQAVYQSLSVLKGIVAHTDKNIIDGIRNVVANTKLTGRWQILGSNPLTICDTGHNKEGLEYVLAQINRIPRTGLHMVIGFVNDKDLKSVLPLFPEDAVYYFTKASVPRALDENILKSEASLYGLMGQSYPDVASALSQARANASESDMIFIGGSTFIVAEVV
jgi:dihydrofolate synthase/folylpolyglutamate synthase